MENGEWLKMLPNSVFGLPVCLARAKRKLPFEEPLPAECQDAIEGEARVEAGLAQALAHLTRQVATAA